LIITSALWAIACGSSASTSVTATAPSTTRCQPSVTSSASSFGADGGTGTLAVSVARECGWTANSQANWIQITSATTGQGDGTVAFRVGANADPVTRHAAIVVENKPTDLTQAAAPCRFDVSGPTGPLAASGAQTVVAVQTNQACSWSASADAAWVSLKPASGQGSGQITVTATPNAGPERIATLTIGQDQIHVQQSAPAAPPAPAPPTPAPTPSPTPTPTPPSPTPTPTPTPTPAPTPTPTPTPTPQPAPIEVKGRVDHLFGFCPDVWFNVNDQLVHATADTEYKGKDNSCSDLRDKQVTVKGPVQTILDRQYVLAQSIEIKK
jgi:hypothetical protein